MGAHLIDQPFWALNLGAPKTIQASSTPFNKDSYPLAEIITYEFGARGKMPPVPAHLVRRRVDAGPADGARGGRMMGDDGGGCLFVGTKGSSCAAPTARTPASCPRS